MDGVIQERVFEKRGLILEIINNIHNKKDVEYNLERLYEIFVQIQELVYDDKAELERIKKMSELGLSSY